MVIKIKECVNAKKDKDTNIKVTYDEIYEDFIRVIEL